MQVNKEKCIHCGICVTTHPDLFKMADDGAELIKQPTTKEEIASFKSAQAVCPMQAIED